MNYAIIAAGEGSRLVKDGIEQPKPLVRLNGKPLIDRLIDIFLKNDAGSINIIVNEEMEMVQEHLRKKDLKAPLNLIVKSTPSSMHSFFEISRLLGGGKFCLTTVDTIFREDEFSGFIRSFMADEDHDGMMAVTGFIDDEKPLYVAVDDKMEITGFLDGSDGSEKYISGGIYCLSDSALPILDQCMENGIARMRNYQRELIRNGLKLKAYPFGKIVDVDHAGDIEKAEQFLLSCGK
ncbi:MAG: NTP transferase domain-containing protein [Dysgonamonadaceae bacterium]|jgi:NDP-sugar pyrophosphorylase family protein|nr:NTP transferase domain-containing protein [Dysgonamonadaceae bacterium]